MKFCDFKLDKLFQWQSQKEIDPLKISSLEETIRWKNILFMDKLQLTME